MLSQCECGCEFDVGVEVAIAVGREFASSSGQGGHTAVCPSCGRRFGNFPDRVISVKPGQGDLSAVE
jgi:hypothetical protein